jgi:diguanylate cyclase (GGDEF)-like protein/PAS domain S-box-containing protein
VIGLFEVEGSTDLVAAFQNIPTFRPKVALLQKDQTALILQIDEATSEILGWSRADMVGRRSLEFIEPEDQPRAIANWMDMLHALGARRRVRLRHRHRDGSWVWFELTNHNLLDDPAYGYVLTEMVDISEEMAVHDSLRSREHLLRRLTDLVPLGIFQIDAGRRIVYRNARVASILGNSRAESAGTQLSSVLPSQRPELERALNAVLLEGQDRDLEISLRRRGKHLRRCTLSLRALSDDSGAVTGAIVCVADVTESVRMREELEHRATFDQLTRCYNRASILQALERTLAEPQPDGSGTGVIFLDLDRFKDINDRLGHAAGDVFLVEVARRVASCTREADLVGRIGGDEFLVVCTGVPDEAAALKIAEHLADALGASEALSTCSGSASPEALSGASPRRWLCLSDTLRPE